MQSRDSTLACAVVQTNSGSDWQRNLSDVRAFIELALTQGARLIVLPENVFCFGTRGLDALSQSLDTVLSELQSMCDDHCCALVCGSVPFSESGSEDSVKYRSRSYLLRPNQKPTAYDKIHLFDVTVEDKFGSYRESDTYVAGSEPCMADVFGRRLGMSICYDLRFPELYQCYMKQSADLISVPSAFTYATGKAHWKTLLQARAIETQSFVLAANQCSLHDSTRETWGNSMIVSPSGEILAQAGHEPQVCMARLDFNLLEQVRTAMPLIAHKRLV